MIRTSVQLDLIVSASCMVKRCCMCQVAHRIGASFMLDLAGGHKLKIDTV